MSAFNILATFLLTEDTSLSAAEPATCPLLCVCRCFKARLSPNALTCVSQADRKSPCHSPNSHFPTTSLLSTSSGGGGGEARMADLSPRRSLSVNAPDTD
ncbi:hypothetical protein ATANTOWER_000606 [Ataeniobius toweri]|uniref:Secreted protein n=1 Tax=Ataeniobius toweri TaxID=208326 RepID=A0ABU7AD67_9TELE|nr:hypothetical protein [Ataeniobius toweri]